MELTPAEGRVLGCLIEKQVDGPDAYSLTLNELRFACNQTTGRSPVVTYDDRTVEETLLSLKSKGLARFVPAINPSGGRRGPVRCRHRADDRWRLSSPQLSVLSVLLLRGAQTVEEVRSLVSGHPLLETASEVEAVLDSLAGRTPAPFATRVPPASPRDEVRWVEVLTGWPDEEVGDEPEPGGHDDRDRTDPVPATTYTAPAAAPGVTTGPSPLTMVELADRLSNIERRLAGIEAVLGSVQRALEGRGSDQPPSRLRA